MNLESLDELGKGNPLIQSSDSLRGQKVLGRGSQPRCCAGQGSQSWLMDQQNWKQVIVWAPRALRPLRNVTEGCH